MSVLTNLAKRYQSMRVARDVLMGDRVDIGDMRDWWWFDPRQEVERIEAERAKSEAVSGELKNILRSK